MKPIKYGVLPLMYQASDYGHDPMWDLTTSDVYDQVWCHTLEELDYKIFRDIALEIIVQHIKSP